MPVLARSYLANKLRQNWIVLDQSNEMTTEVDDSLTNLDWLQNIGKNTWTPTNAHRNVQMNPNKILNVRFDNTQERISTEYLAPCSPVPNINQLDYSTNRDVKPPHSYVALIFMEIEAADRRKLTLSSIYDWIKQNYRYYKDAACGWKNSIRHTLTINKCFVKVPRNNNEPGKGSFWRINPTYSHLVKTESFKRKIYSHDILSPSKRSRGTDCDNLSTKQLKGNDPCFTCPTNRMGDNVVSSADIGSFMNQNIEIGGIGLKTEELINSSDEDSELSSIPRPLTSSIDTKDVGINDYFTRFAASLHNDNSVDTSLHSTCSSFDDSFSNDSDNSLESWWSNVVNDNENTKPSLYSPPPTEFKFSAKQTDFESHKVIDGDVSWFNDITTAFDLSDIFTS